MDQRVPLELGRLLAARDASSREAAWEQLIADHSPLLLRLARSLGGDHDAAMDRYACILERLRKHDFCRLRAHAPDPHAKFSTWLVIVARRLCHDRHRERYGRPCRIAGDVDVPQGMVEGLPDGPGPGRLRQNGSNGIQSASGRSVVIVSGRHTGYEYTPKWSTVLLTAKLGQSAPTIQSGVGEMTVELPRRRRAARLGSRPSPIHRSIRLNSAASSPIISTGLRRSLEAVIGRARHRARSALGWTPIRKLRAERWTREGAPPPRGGGRHPPGG